MPLDRTFDLPRDRWFYNTCTEQLRFSLLPRRCCISGQLLWLRRAIRCERMITGPGEPVYDIRWHDPNEYFLMKLGK